MMPRRNSCAAGVARLADKRRRPEKPSPAAVVSIGRDRARGVGQFTASTSRTSGTKWRSMFSMPFFSVMVELGQPEQAPCMCR